MDTYYQILGPLFRRLMKNNRNGIENDIFDEDFRILRGVYNLNKIFQRNFISDDLRSKSKTNKIFDELLEEIVEDFNKGTLNIESIFSICDKLATFLSLDKDPVLIKFCEKVAKYDAIVKIAEHLYQNESDSKNLCLVAILLLKYMGSCNTQLLSDSCTDQSFELVAAHSDSDILNDENSSNAFISGLKLSEKIIVKALVKAKDDEVIDVMEAMDWINTSFYLIRSEENPLEAELFNHMYHSENALPGYSTLAMVSNIFNVFCSFIGKRGNPITSHKYLISFVADDTTLTEEQLVQEIALLPETVDNLCRDGQHLTAYKLLITLENALHRSGNIDQKTLTLLNSIINKKCLPQLLHVVVSAKHIDMLLFENLLLASQKDYFKYIEHYIKLYKRQPNKLHDIATVGIKLLNFHKVTTGKDVLLLSVITCKWWNRLKSSITSIPYDVFFKASNDNRLKQLLKLELLDVKMIQEYCKDYSLDLQIYYMEYLKSILVNWKPDYEFKTDPNGGRGTLIMKNDEVHLYSKCLEVIKVIKDTDAVNLLLDKIWDTANFYHYEVFICIIKILSDTGNSQKKRDVDMPMLLFLKNYHRFSMPSQSEKEQWYSTFPDSQMLDSLSEFRLPFIQTLFSYDIWNIIRPEINLKSYRYWFGAINILRKNLKKDDICIFAIKEVVSSGILGKEESSSWTLYPKFEDLFAEVDTCLQNISDLERATSVVYHLMYHTPDGADKVNAAQLSYKYAQKYKEKNPNSSDVDKAYIKVRTKYYSFSAMHILHMFQLADDKYIQLVAQPEDLIDALYRDERIIKQAECINFSCPDINKAVDALGELFDLKVVQIRYNLLNHLLNFSSDLDLDCSLVIAHNMQQKSNNDDNLKRATYICSSGTKAFWQNYLLRVGLNEDDVEGSDQRNLSFKAKALKCFCAISDVETITHLTELDYKEFLNYIDKISLLSELEYLGISLNVEMLDIYNKKDLLKRLSKVAKPAAVKVMASICITYFINDLQYWEFICNSAIKFSLYHELKTYVDFLKSHCYKKFYIHAWQVIIDHAFHTPINFTTEEVHEVYIKNFAMLQSCPVLYSLNLEGVISKCIKFEKFQFATLLLQYLPGDKKDIYLKMIPLSRALLLDLDNLSKSGIWGIRNIKAWLATKGLC